jgi:cephalosporin-C deacetylase-like acetyl esterase
MKRSVVLLCIALGVLAARSQVWAQVAPPPSVTVVPDHADGIYNADDFVHWTVTWVKDENPPATAKYVLKSGGEKEIGTGPLTFDGKTAHFDSTFSEPNSVLAVITWDQTPTDRGIGGAIAGPYQIQAAADEPADFDAFWKTKLDDLKQIPPTPVLTEEDGDKPGVKYAKIMLDNINGTHVQGQIARPAAGEKFPALLIPQWAGVYALQKSWVTGMASGGWLTMNIEAHDIPIDNPPAYYKQLYGKGGALENYWKIGNTDKDKSYYLRMYLSVCQSIEYLKTRPDWNGKTIVVMGTSQGGQQTLVAAGLYPQTVTAALAFVPAASDNWAESIGRHSGFPFWWQQVDNRDANAVHQTSKYFDPVYFARRIKCPVLCGCGLRDELAPCSSVLAAFNQIAAPKQLVILPRAEHQDENGTQAAYTNIAYGQWLPALAKGETPPVKMP